MKGYNSLSILCAVLLFGAVLVSPTFANKEKIDDAELALTNLPVTGTSIKKPINCVEKNGICEEIKLDRVTSGKVAAVSSPAEINTTSGIIDKSMMLGGDTAFTFGMGASTTSNRVGGTITTVQPHYEKYLY